MSAGTGVYHSEYNKNKDREVKFLQIWVYPKIKDVTPRYDQVAIRNISTENEFYQILSPSPNDQGVWIHQEAWFYMGKFDEPTSGVFRHNNPNNGSYFFVLQGEMEVEGTRLSSRDGFGVWDINAINYKVSPKSEVLVMEVPMQV